MLRPVKNHRTHPKLEFAMVTLVFGVEIDKDVVRRILSVHYRPESDSSGPSWLTFLGHMKDNYTGQSPSTMFG